jgi:ATP-dependent Clp protease ATP-binding subunit ClpC
VEKDAALERRFQPVTIEEPTREQAIDILQGLKSRYEEHHGVQISDEGVKAAVELSDRYINDRYLPDKAIDLIDEASARLRLSVCRTPEELLNFQNKSRELEKEFVDAIASGDMERASQCMDERAQAEASYEKAKKRLERSKNRKKLVVGETEIAEVISKWTKIPIKRLTEGEAERLRRLEKTLHKRVVGQEDAVSAVARAVRRGRVGLKDPNRPIGSFLFLGPTGVGKTEVSKALAEAIFGNEQAMIRVDMSEYMEKHSVSKMIGSPPGYVGFDEGGQLSEKVRRNPYSVILFDEIEKAHPDVFNILLQVLDDGRITDSQGRRIDFKNTIIIMTSNAGAQSIVTPKKLGFASTTDEKQDYERMKSLVMEDVSRIFKPEFLNRIDETIVFRMLNKTDMKQIVTILSKTLTERCKSQMNIELSISEPAKAYIVDKAYDPKYGARPLRRMIQTKIEDQLAEEILSGQVKRGDSVRVSVKKKELVFEVKK